MSEKDRLVWEAEKLRFRRDVETDKLRLQRDIALVNSRLVAVQADRDRLLEVVKHPTIRAFLVEAGFLWAASDPSRGQGWDAPSRSADPPAEGDATGWARAGWRRLERGLARLTVEAQAWMGTPPGERNLVDAMGGCVTCGRRPGARTRVWRKERSG